MVRIEMMKQPVWLWECAKEKQTGHEQKWKYEEETHTPTLEGCFISLYKTIYNVYRVMCMDDVQTRMEYMKYTYAKARARLLGITNFIWRRDLVNEMKMCKQQT